MINLTLLGDLALYLAAATALASVFNTLFTKLKFAAFLANLQAFLILFASVSLIFALVNDDFSLKYVAEHSNRNLPLFYKICAFWGGHEGSLLLWLLILNFWIFAFAKKNPLKIKELGLLAYVNLLLSLFVIFTSNPFLQNNFTPFDGRDLNPLLQDIGLALHPPLLYAGYAGFAVIFAQAVAILWRNNFADKKEFLSLKSWLLAAWFFLTLGIILGSYWAYYELGWGGFWFWDPVENSALMPWLSATALIHANAAYLRNKSLISWVIFLAILTFGLSLLGTFLVRSGVLTSVHSFANDSARGVFILALIALIIFPALILFIIRQIPREKILKSHYFAVILLISFLAIVFLGTLYPLIADILKIGKISVGAPYFNKFAGIAAILSLSGLIFFIFKNPQILKNHRATVAHLGFIIMVLAITITSFKGEERDLAISQGEKLNFHNYQIELLGFNEIKAKNFTATQGRFLLSQNNKSWLLKPAKRIYFSNPMPMTESARLIRLTEELYIALGEKIKENRWAIRLQYKPFIDWIWLGALIFAFSTFVVIRGKNE